MRIVRPCLGHQSETKDLPSCVAAMGNCDGVHLGHQALLQAAQQQAQRVQLPAALITLEPPPQTHLGGGDHHRLSTFRDKMKQVARCGIDLCIVLRCTPAFMQISATTWLSVLQEQLHVRHLVVGTSFRFGCDREGDVAFLKAHWPDQALTVVPDVCEGGKAISSTRIRHALSQHNVWQAAQWLGHPYTLSGRVRRGAQRGRLLGFPTANIAVPSDCVLEGIFVVTATHEGRTHPAVAHLGPKPTLGDDNAWLEVHVLDGTHDWYGAWLEIAFLKHLRPIKRFDSLDALTRHIADDVAASRAYFATHPVQD